MKKLITISAAALAMTASLQLSAQTFGVKGGLNFSNLVIKDNDDSYDDDNKLKPGIHIGGTAEFEINDMVSFEPGALISMKGTKNDDASRSLLYLEIPMNAKAAFDLGGTKVFGLAGPYLGVAVSGKDKVDDESESIEFGSGDGETKRLDFGLNIGAGAQITDEISAGLSYGLGLANLSNSSDNGYKIQNRVIALSVGYKLGK